MRKNRIAVVVPTIRDTSEFSKAWDYLFRKHEVDLIFVRDGETPTIEWSKYPEDFTGEIPTVTHASLEGTMGEFAHLIYNFNDGVRNLGFAFAYKHLKADIIISLDDDVRPMGDTIQDHIDALNAKYPISWMNTTMTDWMRGMPYNVRQEAECMVSHGVWVGVPDYGAIEQLSLPIREQEFYRGAVPVGVRFPFCAMNFAFKAGATPYIYQAPMGPKIGLDRFADIWGGVELKRDMDMRGLAVVTGFAFVHHERASNVYKNLQKEAKGIELNDHYGEDEYFRLFEQKRREWKRFILTETKQ